MNPVSKFLMLSLTLFLSGTCVAADTKNSLVVTITTPATTVKSGDGVTVNLTISNQSGSPVSFIKSIHRDGFGVDYAIKMTAPGGKISTSQRHAGGSHQVVSLGPGDEVREAIHLEDDFNITKPGEYAIQVAPFAVVGDEEIKANSWSNAVTVTVNR